MSKRLRSVSFFALSLLASPCLSTNNQNPITMGSAAVTGAAVGTGAVAGVSAAIFAGIEAASMAAAAPFLASPWCP